MTESGENAAVHSMFQELLGAAARGDETQVKKLLDVAHAKGLEMAVDSNVVDVTWEDFPLLVVDYVVKLGDVPVTTWREEWSGNWGGGGTGWWPQQLEFGEQPDGLSELLVMTGLEPYAPDVPRNSDEVEEYWRKNRSKSEKP